MLKNKLIKFITSLLLFLSMVMYYFNCYEKMFGLVIVALCVIKFVVVTILEPDSIWEIIKKFFYIIIGVLFIFALINNNVYCERIAEILIMIDTVIETHRARKKIKNIN